MVFNSATRTDSFTVMTKALNKNIDQIKLGNLVYENKQKSLEWSHRRGLSLPTRMSTQGSLNVIQKEDIVNKRTPIFSLSEGKIEISDDLNISIETASEELGIDIFEDAKRFAQAQSLEDFKFIENNSPSSYTNEILDKIRASGIEVITDKDEFDIILEHEKRIQKIAVSLLELESLHKSIEDKKRKIQNEKLRSDALKKRRI